MTMTHMCFNVWVCGYVVDLYVWASSQVSSEMAMKYFDSDNN